MEMTVIAFVQWIREECGGRAELPVVGLRPMVRWQRFVREWLSDAWDAEITELDVDPDTRYGTVKLRFPPNASIQREWLIRGEPIELLDAYHVIGVGRIDSWR